MKTLLLLLATVILNVPLWAQPVCGSLSIDDVTPHGFRVSMTCDMTISYVRVKYGLTLTSEFTQGVAEEKNVLAGSQVVQTVTGLIANTNYVMDVEASANGTTWSTPLNSNQTTAAAVSGYGPTPPTIAWNPHVTTPRSGTTFDVTCTTLHSALTTKVLGDTIRLATGTPCETDNVAHAPDTIFHLGVDGARFGWSTGWTFSTTTERGTKTSHGFSNDQAIRLAGQYNGELPPAPLNLGQTYYIKLIDANTVEFAHTAGGATIDLTTTGSTTWLSAHPFSCVNELVITTQGADTNFPPEGVRTGPVWEPNLAVIRGDIATDATIGTTAAKRTLDLAWGAPRCVKFVNLKFEPKSSAAVNDPDPPINGKTVFQTPANDHITYDRVIFKAPNLYPYRQVAAANASDGTRIAFINSHFENIGIWLPWHDHGLAFTGTSISINAGTHRIGKTPACTNTASVTSISGAVTGTIYTERDGACAIYVVAPTGLSGTCSGCTYSNSATPDWSNASNAYTRFPISNAAVSSGTVTSHNSIQAGANPTSKRLGSAEGTAGAISAAFGPGPYLVENNTFLNTIGIPVYLGTGDGETATLTPVPQHLRINRNVFRIDGQYIPSEPDYAGRARYPHRNFFECKSCRYLQLNGNIFSGNYRSNNNGPSIVISPLTAYTGRSENTAQDIEVGYNTIERSAVGITITGRYPGPADVGKPTRRVKVHNNLFSIDGRIKEIIDGEGTAFQLFHGPWGIDISNNTFLEQRGSAYALFLSLYCHPIAGLSVSNNLLFLNNDSSGNGVRYSNCPAVANAPNYDGQTAKTALDNVTKPVYTFRGNAVLCGYSIVSTATSLTSTECDTMRTAYGTLTSSPFWTSGSTVSARRDLIKFLGYSSGNYRLRFDSPFRSADYAAGYAGADPDALDQAQGRVTGVSARLTAATTLALDWTAPDVDFKCYGEVLTDAGAFVVRTQAAQASRRQGVTFAGLTAATPYQWRVLCQAEQPTGRFMTR